MNRNQLRRLLSGLTDSELENLVRVIEEARPIAALWRQREARPILAPRKSVKQMVQEYENNIIPPPPEFRDKPIPTPRTKKQKPVPAPRTKIVEKRKALKGILNHLKYH